MSLGGKKDSIQRGGRSDRKSHLATTGAVGTVPIVVLYGLEY